MNLRLIEKRFQHLDVQANYLNYKYNPKSQKISGLGQHAYLDELKTDHQSDLRVFGQDPFSQKAPDVDKLRRAHESQSSINGSIFDDFESKKPGIRPMTSQPAAKLKGTAMRNIQSQQQLLRKKMRYYQNSSHYDWNNTTQKVSMSTMKHVLDHVPQVKEVTLKKKITKIESTQQNINMPTQETQYSFKKATQYLKPEITDSQIKNINQIMESLCQIKIPAHIFEILQDNKDLINDHYLVSEKLEQFRYISNPESSQIKYDDDYDDIKRNYKKGTSGVTSSATPSRVQTQGIQNTSTTPLKMSPRFSSNVYKINSGKIASSKRHHQEFKSLDIQNRKGTSTHYVAIRPESHQMKANIFEEAVNPDIQNLLEKNEHRLTQQPRIKIQNRRKQIEIQEERAKSTIGMQPNLDESYPTRMTEKSQQGPPQKIIEGLVFNLKITDISDLQNPFVIFEDRPITKEGVIQLDQKYLRPDKKIKVNPCLLFPWLKQAQDIERKTLKIEIVYRNDLIMCRYLHLNKLYPIEYSKIALQISNNIYQNQYLLYKENKIQSLYKKDSVQESDIANTLGQDPSKASETQDTNRMKQSIHLQQIRDSAYLLVFDGSKNIEVDPNQCVLKLQKDDPVYYYVNPAIDRNYILLQDIQYCKFHVKDLPQKIQSQEAVAQIKPEDLINFPKFTKNAQKIVIEFQDCMIQAIDLLDFQILIDDNKKRANKLIEFEQSQKQSLALLKGNNVTKDINSLRTFNSLFNKKAGPTTVDPKLIKQAFQDRGMNQLIRKYHQKKAEENRKSIERMPKQPNSYLKNVTAAKGAICAAEMKDKRQIFNHLVNTSLITAPLLVDYESQARAYPDDADMQREAFEDLISLQSKSFMGENGKPILSQQIPISPKQVSLVSTFESQKQSQQHNKEVNSPVRVQIPGSGLIQIVENTGSVSDVNLQSFDNVKSTKKRKIESSYTLLQKKSTRFLLNKSPDDMNPTNQMAVQTSIQPSNYDKSEDKTKNKLDLKIDSKSLGKDHDHTQPVTAEIKPFNPSIEQSKVIQPSASAMIIEQ